MIRETFSRNFKKALLCYRAGFILIENIINPAESYL